jgi:hypothetical protein
MSWMMAGCFTASETLAYLELGGDRREKIIGIIIADRAGLEEITCACYGKIHQTSARLLPVPPSWT